MLDVCDVKPANIKFLAVLFLLKLYFYELFRKQYSTILLRKKLDIYQAGWHLGLNLHSEYFKCSNWKEWKLLFWKTKISHWKKRKRDSENNRMIDWEINTAHYCLFKQLGALNKVFLISLLWWLTSFFTLKNHSWNSRMNWFLPAIINYSTSNCRKLLIFPTLHLQNSGLILPPFISCSTQD